MNTKKIASLGLMLAIMLVLTTAEAMFAPLPLHIKPGLANIVVMFCVFSIGAKEAVMLNVLKAFFVLITRGAMAGLLSLCGGLLSVGVIILLRDRKFSYATVSVAGAVWHNVGQLAAAAVLLANVWIIYYLPVMLVSAVFMGLLTGALLRLAMPAFDRLLKKSYNR